MPLLEQSHGPTVIFIQQIRFLANNKDQMMLVSDDQQMVSISSYRSHTSFPTSAEAVRVCVMLLSRRPSYSCAVRSQLMS